MKLDPDAPAFPTKYWVDGRDVNFVGLTVRQHISVEMAKGILASPLIQGENPRLSVIAQLAVDQADALIYAINHPIP